MKRNNSNKAQSDRRFRPRRRKGMAISVIKGRELAKEIRFAS